MAGATATIGKADEPHMRGSHRRDAERRIDAWVKEQDAMFAARYDAEFMNPKEALSLGSISEIVMPNKLRSALGRGGDGRRGEEETFELFLPLTVGGHVEIAPRDMVVDGFRLVERLKQGDITTMQATPTLWAS